MGAGGLGPPEAGSRDCGVTAPLKERRPKLSKHSPPLSGNCARGLCFERESLYPGLQVEARIRDQDVCTALASGAPAIPSLSSRRWGWGAQVPAEGVAGAALLFKQI